MIPIGGVAALFCLGTVVVRGVRREIVMGHILAEPRSLALVHEALRSPLPPLRSRTRGRE